jgi:large subunit ribosomal protein L9
MMTDATQKKVHTDLLQKNLGDLNGVTVTIHGKANEKGHLFASIHKEEILLALNQATHLDMHPDYVILDRPIKALGTYEIPVEIGDIKAMFTVVVE